MKPEVRFLNIFMYLNNKNILEYAQIAQSEPKYMILNIEGRSIIQGISKLTIFFSHKSADLCN